MPIFSVQYHPEASPGPHDASYLFDAFVEMMKSGKPLGKDRFKILQEIRERVGG
jgi:carbamoyl-phosphate synthase small subunit